MDRVTALQAGGYRFKSWLRHIVPHHDTKSAENKMVVGKPAVGKRDVGSLSEKGGNMPINQVTGNKINAAQYHTMTLKHH